MPSRRSYERDPLLQRRATPDEVAAPRWRELLWLLVTLSLSLAAAIFLSERGHAEEPGLLEPLRRPRAGSALEEVVRRPAETALGRPLAHLAGRLGYNVAYVRSQPVAGDPGAPRRRRAGELRLAVDTPDAAALQRRLRWAVARLMPLLQACYDAQLLRDHDARGRVVLRYVIDPRGRVRSVLVARRDFGDPAFGSCLATRARRLRPVRGLAPGERLVVEVPIRFAPGRER